MKNIEIKARYSDLTKAQRIATSLGAKLKATLRQTDTYFKTPNGKLKLREFSGDNATEAQLIPYMRNSEAGPKASQYATLPVQNAAHVKRLFSDLLGSEIVVQKSRGLYLWQNVRIHLDQVKGLGSFIEFEAVIEKPSDEPQDIKRVNALIQKFEIPESDLVKDSYRDLLAEAGTGTGAKA